MISNLHENPLSVLLHCAPFIQGVDEQWSIVSHNGPVWVGGHSHEKPPWVTSSFGVQRPPLRQGDTRQALSVSQRLPVTRKERKGIEMERNDHNVYAVYLKFLWCAVKFFAIRDSTLLLINKRFCHTSCKFVVYAILGENIFIQKFRSYIFLKLLLF